MSTATILPLSASRRFRAIVGYGTALIPLEGKEPCRRLSHSTMASLSAPRVGGGNVYRGGVFESRMGFESWAMEVPTWLCMMVMGSISASRPT